MRRRISPTGLGMNGGFLYWQPATEKGFKDICSPSSSSVTDNACAYTIAIVIYYRAGKYESLRTAYE